MTNDAVVVVPCYNEGLRLDEDAFVALVDGDPAITLLFVNDGSNDNTGERLASLRARRPNRVDVLTLTPNGGKAEAVRRGLLDALKKNPELVGYLDADLATPIEEVRRLLDIMRAGNAEVLIAARVSLLGRAIERKPLRHYLGRIFASTASLVLRMAVYDTQCGAKFFRRSPTLEAALLDPFLSKWIFDVELLGRLVTGAPRAPAVSHDRIVEEPLRVWRDVPGSKLGPMHMVNAVKDIARIAADLRRRRALVLS